MWKIHIALKLKKKQTLHFKFLVIYFVFLLRSFQGRTFINLQLNWQQVWTLKKKNLQSQQHLSPIKIVYTLVYLITNFLEHFLLKPALIPLTAANYCLKRPTVPQHSQGTVISYACVRVMSKSTSSFRRTDDNENHKKICFFGRRGK